MIKTDQLTLQSFFRNSVKEFADNDFMTFVDGTPYKFSDFENIVDSIIHFLEQSGIKKGDRVAILSQNMPNWGAAYFAIVSMGAIAVPLLPDFHPGEIENILNHSESKAIFVSNGLKAKIEGFKNKTLDCRISIEDFSVLEGKTNVEYQQDKKPKKNYIVDEEDLAVIIYTSGTTGTSKGVMLTHKNLAFDAVAGKKVQPVESTDRFLSILPLSHTYENTLGLILPLISGACIYYLKKLPSPSVLIPAMAKVKPTIMLSVPLVIEKIYRKKILSTINEKFATKALYKVPFFRKKLNKVAGKKLMKTFGGEIKFFGIGGAKLNRKVEVFLREAKFPYAIGYGLTETSPLLAGLAPEDTILQSTGPAIEGAEIKLHNINTKTGEGEVWAKGPNIMKGYYKEPELTKDVLTEDGWLKTGDLAILDKEQNLYIKGRLKNVIIGASGENIFPEEIESVINNFRYVVESVVIEQKGKLVALVHFNMEELENRYEHMKTEVTNYVEQKIDELAVELQEYVNSRVNKFSRVQLVIAHPTPFTKTATQKIKRFLYT